MAATKVLIILAIASLLLVNEQEIISLQTSPESWAGQAGLKPGEVFRDRLKTGNEGPEMVVIPAGKFRMGDIQGKHGKDEQPVHEVHIARRFAMSKYEIIFDQYDDFAKATGRKLPDDEGWGRGRQPAIDVSFNDAVAYAKWLSQQTGKHYRLPTEAEWEYAARAGTETVYWWGNDMQQGFANCVGCGSRWAGKQPGPVGSFKPNQFGLYDTAGNVAERVQDCWHENYEGRLRTDQLGKKETEATAAVVWLVAAVGTGRTIGRVRRTGSVIAQASAAVRLDFALSGKSIDDFLYYLP